ncbi:TetR family transcriptional regulator [Paenibacillus cellulosilyticus]|uniref:TetR family transcriptional regulator n=1 Tax=Paenibacillus cellulosilyticus TaxID=375489 RepID=A0A2V2YPG9_9BACL|nr:TetR/AcrR family transcriptional regulator [Paenibacillus cellulosilyticus]PWV97929.1 TetR family transcriptional regulator [Paenibacillus cellulosilyticus]QKS44034.1 TetR/AcrR family transcriptional regulator [Paenibacillus cellulosilyticus]
MKNARPTKALGRPKRSEQDAPTRDTIIQIASRLFLENGYEPISLNQIAVQCGMTKASLYYHFANKAELFTESLIWMLTRARMSTEKLLHEASDLKSGLETLAIIKMSTQHMDFESIMRESSSNLTEEQLTRIRETEHNLHDVLAIHFQAAMDKGHMRQANPLLLAHTLSAMLMLGNRQEPADLFESVPELAKAIIDLFWNGVTPE